MKTLTNPKKLDALQDLRGIAAMIVLIYHASGLFSEFYNKEYLFGIFKQGYSGVDLFFVLSGFIITYIHFGDIGNRTMLKNFALKRFFRIYPVYWIVLLPLIPLYQLIPSFGFDNYRSLEGILKSVSLFPQDLHLMAVAWTLSHEMIFYIMFSLLIALKPKIAYPILSVWIIVTLCFTFGVFNAEYYAINALFSPLNFEFLAGTIIAYLIVKNKLAMSKLFIFSGLAAIAFFWTLENMELLKIHRVVAYGLPFALLIYGTVTSEMTRNNTYSMRITRFLGDASYSIYLTHYPLLSMLNKVFAKFNIYALFGGFISVTLLILIATSMGILFYLVVERNVIAFAKRQMSRDIIVPKKEAAFAMERG